MTFLENAEDMEETVWERWGKTIGVPILLNGKPCMMTLAEVYD